jgi:uridine phosphorylase
VGAPLAAGFLEEMIALGGSKFIGCGGCGVLHEGIIAGHPVILSAALRDEGTSYHYLPPGREVNPSPAAVAALEQVFQARGIEYRLAKTWTTDGLYRETPLLRDKRLGEGCEVVEMEAAAFFAVAQFRGVTFGQVVYGGDLVIPDGWDHRGWDGRKDDRQALFWLALEACLLL